MAGAFRLLRLVSGCQNNLLNLVKPALHKQLHVARWIHATSTTCAFKSKGVLNDGENPKDLSRADWEKRLSPAEYFVAREHGTERPFSGDYVSFSEKGTYTCICCGSDLFSSEAKFESGCGWPSFSSALTEDSGDKKKGAVMRRSDVSHGMQRVEVLCKSCNAHLGHVFPDGPPPTGERFCINSVCLNFTWDE